jgi:hypothetical protein
LQDKTYLDHLTHTHTTLTAVRFYSKCVGTKLLRGRVKEMSMPVCFAARGYEVSWTWHSIC